MVKGDRDGDAAPPCGHQVLVGSRKGGVEDLPVVNDGSGHEIKYPLRSGRLVEKMHDAIDGCDNSANHWPKNVNQRAVSDCVQDLTNEFDNLKHVAPFG